MVPKKGPGEHTCTFEHLKNPSSQKEVSKSQSLGPAMAWPLYPNRKRPRIYVLSDKERRAW